MWATIVLVVTLIAVIFYRASLRPPSFPPGPLALPIIGTVLSFLPNPKTAFKIFHKKYGGITSVKVFKSWGIIISDPTLMRSVFADPNYQGRIELKLFLSRNILVGGKEEPLGIIGTFGDVWKHQRRFTLRTLRDQGFGKKSLEPIMQSELAELGDYFASKKKEKFSVGTSFNRSVINVIWAMVIGYRFSYDDERLDELATKVSKMLQTFNPFNPLINFPIFKKLFPNLDIFKKVDGYMKDLLHFIEDQMAIYEEEMEDADDDCSYIGAYLKEMKECAQKDKDTPLTRAHLKANIMELFIAGSETTASTLWWAIYLLASNPKIQQTVHQELDKVVGQGNIPTLEHKDQLPYTTATIYEVQRVADLFPIAIPHQTTADTTLEGYKIPNGTRVMFNLSYALESPDYWKYPDKFYPEHFLTPEGKPYKPDAFMPFGYGKRVCLGESLARLELFLFFSNLLHRFSWTLSDDPVTWEKATIVTRPPNFTVYASERHSVSSNMEFKQG